MNNQKLLLTIGEEMSNTFENLGYGDIAMNFSHELEFKNPPYYWVLDAEDDDRDRELKTRRVQYYFTKHIGPEKQHL